MMKSKETKREEASIRVAHRKTLTVRQQLESLDKILGKDIGATKERLRLMELIKYDEGDKSQGKEKEVKKVKVKKGEDPLKAKKQARREAKRNKI